MTKELNRFRKIKKFYKEVNIEFGKRNYKCIDYAECLGEAARLDRDLICNNCKRYEKDK